jgi:hypothetical protein
MAEEGKRLADGTQELIAVVDRYVGIEVEPWLTPGCGGVAIPGNAQGLLTTAGKSDQMLLQRVHAEGMGDLKG